MSMIFHVQYKDLADLLQQIGLLSLLKYVTIYGESVDTIFKRNFITLKLTQISQFF